MDEQHWLIGKGNIITNRAGKPSGVHGIVGDAEGYWIVERIHGGWGARVNMLEPRLATMSMGFCSLNGAYPLDRCLDGVVDFLSRYGHSLGGLTEGSVWHNAADEKCTIIAVTNCDAGHTRGPVRVVCRGDGGDVWDSSLVEFTRSWAEREERDG